MFKRLKNWIINKYLPAYARESMNERINKLTKKTQEQEREIELLKSYIAGFQAANNNRIKIINKYSDNGKGDK